MEHIIYQLEEDLAIITLNRPDVANGFHIPMCEEILEALTLAEEDSAVHFILINANGKVFSVGGDLVEMKRAVDEDDIPSLTKIAELVNTISYKIKQIAKPVLMEVDGAVAGAAANMAVAADFCLATGRCRFALNVLLQLLFQLIARTALPLGVQHHRGLNHHAANFIGHARNGTFNYGGVRHQSTFHFKRTNAIATTLYHIICTTYEPIVTILVAPCNVARVIHAVVVGLLG